MHKVIEESVMTRFIDTKFGSFSDLVIESLGLKETYSLAIICEPNGECLTLGFDAPIKGHNEWRFWVEIHNLDCYSETNDVEVSESDKEYIKFLYEKYKKKNSNHKKCIFCKNNNVL